MTQPGAWTQCLRLLPPNGRIALKPFLEAFWPGRVHLGPLRQAAHQPVGSVRWLGVLMGRQACSPNQFLQSALVMTRSPLLCVLLDRD